MARKLLCPAALLLALTLIFTGCSVKKVNEIPSSEQVSAFGDFKHYFGGLNENEKRAYNAILRDIESFPEEIEIPELNNEELEKVWLAVMYDNPELIMLGRECMLVSRDRKFWFSCEYAMTKDEYEQKKAELQTKADELGAKIVKETSDFDKELLIHDAIIDSCRYTDSDKLIASSAYGVLVNDSASCEGYAKAAKLLLDKAGIENYVITGTAKREDGASEGHMWNVVFIDGKPYNLDLTWDDPIGEGVTQNKRYAYFNITDEEILKTHTFSDASACCTATENNYFVKLGRQFDGYNAETKTALSNMFGGHKSGDKLDVRFSSEDAYQRAIDGLLKKRRSTDSSASPTRARADFQQRKLIISPTTPTVSSNLFSCNRGEMMDKKRIEAAVREILAAVGEDPDREGLVETPRGSPECMKRFSRGSRTIRSAMSNSSTKRKTKRWSLSAISRCIRCASIIFCRSSAGRI